MGQLFRYVQLRMIKNDHNASILKNVPGYVRHDEDLYASFFHTEITVRCMLEADRFDEAETELKRKFPNGELHEISFDRIVASL